MCVCFIYTKAALVGFEHEDECVFLNIKIETKIMTVFEKAIFLDNYIYKTETLNC